MKKMHLEARIKSLSNGSAKDFMRHMTEVRRLADREITDMINVSISIGIKQVLLSSKSKIAS